MRYPHSALFVSTLEHPDCDKCEDSAKAAAITARLLGSVGGKHRRGEHAAHVHRMGWVGQPAQIPETVR